MTNIIKIDNLELQLAREFLVDENNIKRFQTEIENLKNNVYDFTTLEGVKEAKELKTKSNKFVKELKDFCEPLEADGKKIANARSAITTKLATGKDAVIEQILAPVYEREDKIKLIKNKLFIPSLNAGSNAEKLAEVESFTNYNWLAFEEEAKKLIEQHKTFLLNEKIKFDEEVRLSKEAEVKAKQETENQIRLEAEKKAEEKFKQDADKIEKEKQEAIKEAIKAEQDKNEAEKRKQEIEKQEIEKLAKNKEHKAKIHNEILESLQNHIALENDLAKEIIKAIAKGEIKNLKIIY